MFEIGNSLREARARQGLDVAQVELATKIRGKYIRAIEEEAFDALPAEPYVKGFLRTYAEFLGLDGQLYVDEYDSRFVVDGIADVPVRTERPRRPVDHSFERRAVLLGLVGVVALAALVIVAWKFGGTSGSTPNVIANRSLPAQRGLVFSGPGTYIEVRRGSAAGSVLYEGTLSPGEANFVGGQKFWIRIRHPKHLTLTLNGKAVSLPARKTLKVLVTPSRTALAG
ncbi:MAG TPA: helix-turn-helix domain-containing protein [Gaiellaceae bacterium]|nr:helix-turn-helix domain-containing protein [Gaiellaceae bacterium]